MINANDKLVSCGRTLLCQPLHALPALGRRSAELWACAAPCRLPCGEMLQPHPNLHPTPWSWQVLVTVVDNALRQQLTTGAGRSVPNVTEKVPLGGAGQRGTWAA